MKNKIISFSALTLMVATAPAFLEALALTAVAQTTAIAYQGRLSDGLNPANGIYDFRFAVCDASSNGCTVEGPLTNSAVVVSNGMFTTLIDFGGGPGSSQAIWLDLAVRSNGAAAFVPLTPRTLITPVPLAYYANTASNLSGTLPAAQITGTLPLAQLPAALMTNFGSNASLSGSFTGSFSGSFSGDGAGFTNVNGMQPLAAQYIQRMGGLSATIDQDSLNWCLQIWAQGGVLPALNDLFVLKANYGQTVTQFVSLRGVTNTVGSNVLFSTYNFGVHFSNSTASTVLAWPVNVPATNTTIFVIRPTAIDGNLFNRIVGGLYRGTNFSQEVYYHGDWTGLILQTNNIYSAGTATHPDFPSALIDLRSGSAGIFYNNRRTIGWTWGTNQVAQFDGVPMVTNALPVLLTTNYNTLWLGGRMAAGGNILPFDCDIQSVVIFNCVLTPAQLMVVDQGLRQLDDSTMNFVFIGDSLSTPYYHGIWSKGWEYDFMQQAHPNVSTVYYDGYPGMTSLGATQSAAIFGEFQARAPIGKVKQTLCSIWYGMNDTPSGVVSGQDLTNLWMAAKYAGDYPIWVWSIYSAATNSANYPAYYWNSAHQVTVTNVNLTVAQNPGLYDHYYDIASWMGGPFNGPWSNTNNVLAWTGNQGVDGLHWSDFGNQQIANWVMAQTPAPDTDLNGKPQVSYSALTTNSTFQNVTINGGLTETDASATSALAGSLSVGGTISGNGFALSNLNTVAILGQVPPAPPFSLIGYGNSILAGWGSSGTNLFTPLSGGYFWQVNSYLGTQTNINRAIAGTTVPFQSLCTYGAPADVGSNSATIFDCTANDVYATSNNYTSTLPVYQSIELAELAWCACAYGDKTNTGINLFYGTPYGRLQGIWSNQPVNTNYFSIGSDVYSTNQGDGVLLTNVYGRTIIIGYEAWTNNTGSTMGVWVDGVNATNVSCNCAPYADSTDGYARSNVVLALVISGLASNYHTVAITNASAEKWFGLEYVLFPDMQHSHPPVYDMEMYTPRSGGVPNYYWPATLAAFNAAKQQNVQLLEALGENVFYVPTAAFLSQTDLIDYIHPNASGHNLLFQQVMKAIGLPAQRYSPALTVLATNGGNFEVNTITETNVSAINTIAGSLSVGGTIYGNGAGLTNLSAAEVTNAAGFWAAAPAGNGESTNGFVDARITNGLATLDYVQAATNGLARQTTATGFTNDGAFIWVSGGTWAAPASGFVFLSLNITNGQPCAFSNATQNYYLPVNTGAASNLETNNGFPFGPIPVNSGDVCWFTNTAAGSGAGIFTNRFWSLK